MPEPEGRVTTSLTPSTPPESDGRAFYPWEVAGVSWEQWQLALDVGDPRRNGAFISGVEYGVAQRDRLPPHPDAANTDELPPLAAAPAETAGQTTPPHSGEGSDTRHLSPSQRAKLAYGAQRDRLRDALLALDLKCENFVVPYDCPSMNRPRNGQYGSDCWCLPCEVRAALTDPEAQP